MLDPWQLSYDISGTVFALALTPALWLFLVWFAWERRAFAESVGLGPTVFWLLVPAGLLAYFADLVFVPIGPDLLAINLGGALFPLALSVLLLRRVLSPSWKRVAAAVGCFALETGVAVAAVVILPGAAEQAVAVAACAIGFSLLAWALASADPSSGPEAPLRFAGFVALASGVLVLSFLASQSLPGVGIQESYPTYLLPPIAAGLAAAVLARPLFGEREGLALPLAFAATTLGLIAGTDVLRQPPLYAPGPSELYVIGGANVFDLVYLSGLIALAAAFVGYRLLGGSYVPIADAPEAPPASPTQRLNAAFAAVVEGRGPEAIREGAVAAREAAEQAHRLLDVPPAPAGRPWEGLAVPGWVVADQANLDALARDPPARESEGQRAWLAARFLVGAGRELGSGRWASVRSRVAAAGIDLALVTAPALLLWAYLAHSTGGSYLRIVESVPFAASEYGYIAAAFLYGAVAEAAFGTTVGKRLLGLEVRRRSRGRPDLIAAFLRNAPRLATFTVVSVGLSLALAIAFGPGLGSTGTGPLLGIPALFGFVFLIAAAAFGTAIFGLIGVLGITISSEHQRLGDRWAHTWVVRALRARATRDGPGEAARSGPA